MAYKVYLVEDEITTREGIRDNVDWKAAGFELCGESADGEIALPQIEAIQPDVLVTDIRMPFMDGLQLCRIIREHMAWMKIIIISGYSDFEYAQTAIQLGVNEYLLKPISVQDMQAVLYRVKGALDREKSERAYLKSLRSQVEDKLSLMREKFLLRLVTGGESSISAIEQSQQLGLDILSPYYQVVLLDVQPNIRPHDYAACEQFDQLVAAMVAANKDVLLTKKDMAVFVLILKGENLEQIEAEGLFLAEMIQEEVQHKTGCKVLYGAGAPQQHLGDLHRSFVEAMMNVSGSRPEAETADLQKLDHAVLRRYLETGKAADFNAFFEQSILPLAEAALQSKLLKRYVMVDILLAVAQYVSDLGGDAAALIPAVQNEDAFLSKLPSAERVRAELGQVFAAALAYRDNQAGSDRASLIQKAKDYIDGRFSDSKLSLNEVAAQVNFSPNHFSAVFREETGGTFRDYLTQTRIAQAQKLLRATRLKISEVAYQCGYNDPHYFSVIFRKSTGQRPQQYRSAARK